MKKRFLSVMLTVLMLVSCFSGITISTASADTVGTVDTKIYFDISTVPEEWGRTKEVHCHIYNVFGDDTLFTPGWETKATKATKNNETGLYYYDTSELCSKKYNNKGQEMQGDNHGGLKEGCDYAVIFSTKSTDSSYHRTCKVTLSTECLGDTIYCTGDTVENIDDPSKLDAKASWRENSSNYGPMVTITSTGKIIGDFFPANQPKKQLIAKYIADYAVANQGKENAVTAAILADLCTKLNTEPIDVYNQYITDYSEQLADPEQYPKIASKAMVLELLGLNSIKNITLRTSSIKDPTELVNVEDSSKKYYKPNSYIYFGMNGTTPIKWRVLDAYKANDGTTNGMFLLSEYVLATDVRFNADNRNENVNQYQGSNAQTWCKDFASNSANSENFSSTEQNAMLGVERTDNGQKLYNYSWGESKLTRDDKLFFLSAEELADYVGNYDSAPGLAATTAAQENEYKWWWLRSPHENYNCAGSVGKEGTVNNLLVDYARGARPALNLNPASVLFTSAAVGGKTSGSDKQDGTTEIFENKDYDIISGNDGYKLTLLDENRRDFKAKLEALSNGTASISYSGASTGTKEYISVIIKNGNDVKYYGRVAAVSNEALASGEVEFTLPNDFSTANGDVLCVFNEQYNGNEKTDYASNLITVDFTYTVNFDANGGEGTMASQTMTEDIEGKLNPNSFTQNGYSFNGWNTKADGSGTAYSDEQSVKNLIGTLYAQWQQKSSGSHSSYVQKPIISFGNSADVKVETAADGSTVYTTAEGKLVLSRDGRTASITPTEGYEVENISVNGTDKGAITTLTGLRTGDKLVVSFKLTAEAQAKAEIAQIKALAEKMSLTARSTKTAKKNIKVTLKTDDESTAAIKEIKSLGYTLKYKYYRSTKKASKYAAKLSKTGKTYTNTSGKNGTKYYYKARVQIFDANGKLVAQTALKQCKYASRTWTKK